MKNITVEDLKKETNTLVTYGSKKGLKRDDTDTTIGNDPTNTTFTIVTTSGVFNQPTGK